MTEIANLQEHKLYQKVKKEKNLKKKQVRTTQRSMQNYYSEIMTLTMNHCLGNG